MQHTPLYDALRPQKFEDIEGQSHLIGSHGILTQYLHNKSQSSILLHGPSGCGKTSIAKLYAKQLDHNFIYLSPLTHGISDLKAIVEDFEKSFFFNRDLRVILVDEIHRFNKLQQDFFLPYLEKGSFILVAATTENPTSSINQALLSRLKAFPVYPLNSKSLENLLDRHLQKFSQLSLDPKVRLSIVEACCGDARYLINTLETALNINLETTSLSDWCQKKSSLYQDPQLNHSVLISALQKSIRHSNPNAALYYLARLMVTQEEPLNIARRLIRIATEDIGLADPQALVIANATWEAYNKIGSPEGDIILAECVIYLALAPKSTLVNKAYAMAMHQAQTSSHLSPPNFLKIQGYDPLIEDYDGTKEEMFFPNPELFKDFFLPSMLGFEQELSKRWAYFQKKKTKKNLRLFP